MKGSTRILRCKNYLCGEEMLDIMDKFSLKGVVGLISSSAKIYFGRFSILFDGLIFIVWVVFSIMPSIPKYKKISLENPRLIECSLKTYACASSAEVSASCAAAAWAAFSCSNFACAFLDNFFVSVFL